MYFINYRIAIVFLRVKMINIADYLKSVFISISSIFLITASASAQLIPDRTLKTESSIVVPSNIQNKKEIQGGAIRGKNLFHSFKEFNIAPGSSVYFTNQTGVNNILTRVTGKNISNIFGTLGVKGNANLYLINPNGIYFSNRAKLDIKGSFNVTTQDGIKLGDTGSFSVINPAQDNLLTVKPSTLFTNAIINTTRTIRNEANLELEPGQNLTLSADNIDNFGSLLTPSGNIFIEAINGDINTLGNINASALRDNAGKSIDNGGNISLVATGNITVSNGIQIRSAGILGGDINIKSDNYLRVADGASIRTVTLSEGKGGILSVSARKIEIVGGNPLNGSRSLLLAVNNDTESIQKENDPILLVNTDLIPFLLLKIN